MSTIVETVLKIHPSNTIIHDECEKKYFWQMLLEFWKLPKSFKHFPGPNPVSMERTNFTRIREEDFMISLKTDGIRYLLILTTKPNSIEPIALMIDRAFNMHEVEIWANEEFFYNGCLFDGELVRNSNGNLEFVIFDIVLLKGQSCIEYTYRERLQIIHSHILLVDQNTDDETIEKLVSEEDKLYARNNEHNMQLFPKKCVTKEHIKELWNNQEKCSHRNDGIILTLNSSHVHTGTSKSVFKWKPSHSIDIKCYFKEKWTFFANDNSSDNEINITKKIGKYNVNIDEESKLLKLLETKLSCVVECLINISGNTLYLSPERERSDKKTANTLRTMEATIVNTQENISIDELFNIPVL